MEEDIVGNSLIRPHAYESWIYSIIASILVGLSGIFPLFIINSHLIKSSSGGQRTLRRLLSFAVGGLLGDVFLHLLPEAWQHINKNGTATQFDHICIGLWVLAGIFTFILLEVIFSTEETDTAKDKSSPKVNGTHSNGNGHISNGTVVNNSKANKTNQKQIVGYLNLVANSIDNFTHGLAVAGSFLASTKVGVLTTFAILIHEIPHEIGDFAILLKSGFNAWEAAKAQVLTAGVGLLGAITALSLGSCESLGACTVWILPFTAGGFLNISLVNVLPDLLKEKNFRETLKQMYILILGVAVMAGVSVICE